MRLMPRGAYFGRSLRAREVAGLILTEKVHPVGERTPLHAHSQPYLCLVLDGVWQERCEDGTRHCAPRTLIYHPPGDVHSDHFDTNEGRVFAIEMDATWVDRTLPVGPALQQPRVVDVGPPTMLALRLCDESRRADASSALVVEGLMLELLGALGRFGDGLAASPAPSWLRRVEEILHDEFRQPPSVRDIASLVGVHAVHLARAFRARHGCSIAEYVCRLRIDEACRAMAGSAGTLSEIALDVGFFDQSHFTKAFRRTVGTTPARFRAAVAPPRC